MRIEVSKQEAIYLLILLCTDLSNATKSNDPIFKSVDYDSLIRQLKLVVNDENRGSRAE